MYGISIGSSFEDCEWL